MESLKKNKQMNLFTKQKQTHRLREWSYGYQRERVVERDKLGVCYWHTCTAIFKINNQQGSTIKTEIFFKKERKFKQKIFDRAYAPVSSCQRIVPHNILFWWLHTKLSLNINVYHLISPGPYNADMDSKEERESAHIPQLLVKAVSAVQAGKRASYSQPITINANICYS